MAAPSTDWAVMRRQGRTMLVHLPTATRVASFPTVTQRSMWSCMNHVQSVTRQSKDLLGQWCPDYVSPQIGEMYSPNTIVNAEEALDHVLETVGSEAGAMLLGALAVHLNEHHVTL